MPAVAAGQFVGKYRLIRVLGRGGMGEVWEAVDPLLGRRAAVKILLVASQGNAQQRFFNEARAVNQIAHPGVVQIYDMGTLDDGTGTPWLAMEYLEGEMLSARMERVRGKGELWIATELASILSAAHARGIVHRDVKPQNIMGIADPSTLNGARIKLLDFGIAKLHEDSLTQSGTPLGTAQYMALEQFRDASKVDGRADVFALGVILYQLLSGHLPHEKTSWMEIMTARYLDPIAPLGEREPDLPADLCDLVMRMLAKDFQERPEMAAVEVELRRILGWPARQSGFHEIVPILPCRPSAPPPPAEPSGHEPTQDVPPGELAAMQAAALATPSEQKAVGEISPPAIMKPLSVGSMVSVPMAVPPVGKKAGPRPPEEMRAPTQGIPVGLAEPSAPTARDLILKRKPYALTAALGLSAAVGLTVWLLQRPQHQPVVAPASPPPAVSQPPPTTSYPPPSTTAVVSPPEAKPTAVAQPAAPREVLDVSAPAPSDSKVPERPRSKLTSQNERTCESREVTTACLLTRGLSSRQEELVLGAFRQSGTKLCPGERLTIAGLPNKPTFRTAPPALRRDQKPLLLLVLRGIPSEERLPAQVDVQCPAR